MSNLDELIERLCPDGVEYKTLGDVATISRGGNFQKKDFTDQGKPCIHYGQIYTRYGLFTDKTLTFINDECFAKQKYAEPNDIIMAVTSENIEDICKCVAWLGTEKVAVSGHSAIIHHSLEPKYLAYFFHSQHFFNQKRRLAHGTKVMEVTPDTLMSIKLPVPPLEVQREIVRILDNFTFLTTELAAELAARQKQYEYYRDLLLTFKSNESTILNERTNELEINAPVRWMKLGDIGIDFYRGNGIKRNEVTNDGIPCVRYGEIYTSYEIAFTDCISHTDVSYITNPKYFEHGDILFAITGESIEDIAKSIAYLGSDKCLAGGDIVVMKHNQNPRYLSYALSTLDAIKQKGKGKIKSKVVHASVPSIKEIEIPLPSLEEQEKIANILDNYRFLCNDISNGLPAEIEARQKQYEYYRDKLLTFKELKKEA